MAFVAPVVEQWVEGTKGPPSGIDPMTLLPKQVLYHSATSCNLYNYNGESASLVDGQFEIKFCQ